MSNGKLKIYNSIEEYHPTDGDLVILTLGCFDGVHLGHRFILERVIAAGREINGRCGLLTFDPHPLEILNNTEKPFLLTTRKEKEAILRTFPLDFVVFIPFTREFASLSPETFVREVLVGRFGVKKVIVGQDTHFGHRGAGTVSLLESLGKSYDFVTEVVKPVAFEGEAISSTRIRTLLAEGEIEKTKWFLGYPYCVGGEVVRGDGVGKTIGVPTANLAIQHRKMLPRDGVYAVRVRWDGEEKTGVLNIGFRPTLGGRAHTVEVHILDYSGVLEGETIVVEFVSYLREERKFPSHDKLKLQIFKDIDIAKKIFKI